MGVIGCDLYDNDVAYDVKTSFSDMIYSGISCSEATANVISDFQESLQDNDDCPIVWIALADVQWDMGLLLKNVKKRAIKEIDKLVTADVYENCDFKFDFFENIKRIKYKLDSPMPSKVKIKKSPKIYPSLWEKGDIYRIQLAADRLQYDSVKFLKDRWLMLQVVDIVEEKEKASVYHRPVVRAYISNDSGMPDISQLTELEAIVMFESAIYGFEYRFCITDISELNVQDYHYCGKSILQSESEMLIDIKNIMHFNIEGLANELAWYYYYLKRELNY
ncbi:MAG: hypothetical protein IJC04_00810 [Oscillospiraceae bacterium]|nr:hypothetical protein [Oscillospiraceae bacterium]